MMENMRFTIVQPKLVQLLSTNITDETYPAWVMGEAVGVNEYRIYNKYIFRANEAITVSDTEAPDASIKWYTQQPVNSMAMLPANSQEMQYAEETAAQSTKDGDMDFTVAFRKCNMLALMGVEGSSVDIEEIDPSTDITIKTTTYSVVQHKGIRSIYQYLFRNFEGTKKISNIIHPLTLKFDHKIRVRVYGTQTKINFLCVGITEQFGCTQFSPAKSSISTRPPVRNDFGNVTLSKGNTYVKIDCDIKLSTKDFDTLSSRLEELNDVGILFLVVNDQIEAFQQFGFFASARQVLSGDDISDCAFVIESFIKGA